MQEITLLKTLKKLPSSQFVYLGTDGGLGWFFTGTVKDAIGQLERLNSMFRKALRQQSQRHRLKTEPPWTGLENKEVCQTYRKNVFPPYGIALIVESPVPVGGYWTHEEYRQANTLRRTKKGKKI